MRILVAMIRVAVAGASGYAGGELLRLVCSHPQFELAAIAAGGSAGRRVTSLHPQLPVLADRVFEPTDPERLAAADLLFTALPHGESAALVATLPTDLPIVDLGADFRLADAAAWSSFYGGDHAGCWPYGLPELPGARDLIRGARRVANPGCYATAITLALAPLLAARLVDPSDVVVVAASGTSGAGRRATEALIASGVMGSMSPYKVGGVHQHTPEIEQALTSLAGAPVTMSFTPLLAPMSRGIIATCTATTDATTAELRDALRAAYGDEPFVHVLEPDEWPRTEATYGSNGVQLQVAQDPHAGRAVVCVALDNLGKGAAGQAVQNANLMLGLPEGAGLTSMGVAP